MGGLRYSIDTRISSASTVTFAGLSNDGGYKSSPDSLASLFRTGDLYNHTGTVSSGLRYQQRALLHGQRTLWVRDGCRF